MFTKRTLSWTVQAALFATLLAACGGAAEVAQEPAVEPAPAEAEQVEAMTFDEPTLLAEGLGSEEDLVPTDAEIERAVARLETEVGFVGIVVSTLGTDYHYTVARSARQRAENLGLPVEVYDAETEVENEVQIINDMVERGVKAIVMDVFDPDGVHDALVNAFEHGVYVVQYAGRTTGELGSVTISIEDADLGAVAGEYAGELINSEFDGSANVAILDYPDAPQVVVRATAIRDSLLDVAPQANIVDNYKGGTTEFGFESMNVALQEHPDINVVVSINDAGAYGAYQVLDAAGRTASDTAIVGIDAEEQALEYIAEGTMYRGTVDTAPARTGEMAMNAVVKLLAGGALPQNIRVPVQLVTSEDVP